MAPGAAGTVDAKAVAAANSGKVTAAGTESNNTATVLVQTLREENALLRARLAAAVGGDGSMGAMGEGGGDGGGSDGKCGAVAGAIGAQVWRKSVMYQAAGR